MSWSGCLEDQRAEFEAKGYRQESVGVWSRLPITGGKERIFYVPSVECSTAGQVFVKLIVDVIIEEEGAERENTLRRYHQTYCNETFSRPAGTVSTGSVTTISSFIITTTTTTVTTTSTTSTNTATTSTATTVKSTRTTRHSTLAVSHTSPSTSQFITEITSPSTEPWLSSGDLTPQTKTNNQTLVLSLAVVSVTSSFLAVLLCCCLCCKSESYINFRRKVLTNLIKCSVWQLYRDERVANIRIESIEIKMLLLRI